MSSIVSVNVGRQRAVDHRGRTVSTGIFKDPVESPVRVEGASLAGDDQADRRAHGGTHKAVYAYGSEDYAWWSGRLDRQLPAGVFGDNLTTAGIDVSGAVIGQQWRIGDVVLEVNEPRVPCFKLGIKMGDPRFPMMFSAADRPGTYLRIIAEGPLIAGDAVEVGPPPVHGLTVSDIARIYDRDGHEAAHLLAAPELSEPWKQWARGLVGA